MFLLAVLVSGLRTHAQDIEVTSLASNGRLTWTNSFTNGLFSIEWSPKLGTNWHNNWDSLQNFWVSGGTNTVDVPMFYRVRCATNLLAPYPLGGQFVFSVSNAIGSLSTQQWHVLGYVRPLVPGTNDYLLLETVGGGTMGLFLARSTDTQLIALDQCRLTEFQDWTIAPVGTSWTNFNYECKYTRKVTVDAVEDITVPAGTFTSCYKFHKQILSGTTDPKPEWYEWVKPGFGLVYWVDYWDNNAPVVYRLQSWSSTSQ